MKSLLLLTLAGVALARAPPAPLELTESYAFEEFASHFRPSLDHASEEGALRRSLFKQRLAEAVAHNKANRTWVKAINKFSDWTEAEKKKLLGYKHMPSHHSAGKRVIEQLPTASDPLPASVDWRTRNVLTPIKNQAGCGSCWAFAAVESIESSAAINSRSAPIPLSVEQVVQCTPNPGSCGGTGGCNGATCELAFQYVHNHSGITTAEAYPYTSGSGRTGTCPTQSFKPAAVVDQYYKTKTNDPSLIMQLLANNGPLSVAVDASAWFSYGGGVYDGCSGQAQLTIDHGVQVVAYSGTDPTTALFTIRNSWGSDWGENGFITLAATGACKVDPDPSSGTACPPFDPSGVQVCGPCGLFYDVSVPKARYV